MQLPLPLDLGKKSQASNARAQYTFDVAETEEFINEKFITFPHNHQLPSKDELRGKVYYKYHNSLNHSIKFSLEFQECYPRQGQQGSKGEFPWRKGSHGEILWKKRSRSEVL